MMSVEDIMSIMSTPGDVQYAGSIQIQLFSQ